MTKKSIKNICIFGVNSLISQEFINNHYSDFNILGIYKNSLNKAISEKIKKSYKYDLGVTNSIVSLNEVIFSFHKENKSDQLIFIISSWSGKPRDKDRMKLKSAWETNKNIIDNVIETSKLCKPSQIIFLSSAGALYSQKTKKFSNENDRVSPSSQYGKQKLFAEKKLSKFSNSYFIDFTNLRIATAYGFNPNKSDQGVLNKWIKSAINKKEIELYDSPNSKINFISFEQVSKAIYVCIKEKIFGTYNIGSLNSTSLNELIEIIKKLTNNNKLEVKIKGNDLRLFNIDTSLFKSKAKIHFKNELLSNAKKILYAQLDNKGSHQD